MIRAVRSASMPRTNICREHLRTCCSVRTSGSSIFITPVLPWSIEFSCLDFYFTLPVIRTSNHHAHLLNHVLRHHLVVKEKIALKVPWHEDFTS